MIIAIKSPRIREESFQGSLHWVTTTAIDGPYGGHAACLVSSSSAATQQPFVNSGKNPYKKKQKKNKEKKNRYRLPLPLARATTHRLPAAPGESMPCRLDFFSRRDHASAAPLQHIAPRLPGAAAPRTAGQLVALSTSRRFQKSDRCAMAAVPPGAALFYEFWLRGTTLPELWIPTDGHMGPGPLSFSPANRSAEGLAAPDGQRDINRGPQSLVHLIIGAGTGTDAGERRPNVSSLAANATFPRASNCLATDGNSARNKKKKVLKKTKKQKKINFEAKTIQHSVRPRARGSAYRPLTSREFWVRTTRQKTTACRGSGDDQPNV